MKTIRNFIAALLSGLMLVTATVPVTAAASPRNVVISNTCGSPIKSADLSELLSCRSCETPCSNICDLLQQIGVRCLQNGRCIIGCDTNCNTDCDTGCDTDCGSGCAVPTEQATEIVITPPAVIPTEKPTAPPAQQPTQETIAVPTAPAETTPADTFTLSAYEKEVIELTNRYRAQYGLSPLTADKRLCELARMKSQDMHDKRYFDHNSPTYGSPFDMMKRYGVSYRTAGENIAMGYRTAQSVVEGWMNSPGHRANILNGSFTKIGVGHFADGNYCTQMFTG